MVIKIIVIYHLFPNLALTGSLGCKPGWAIAAQPSPRPRAPNAAMCLGSPVGRVSRAPATLVTYADFSLRSAFYRLVTTWRVSDS